MANRPPAFDLLLSRLSKLRNALLVFAAAALAFVAYDLYFGTLQSRRLEQDAITVKQIAGRTEKLAADLRLVLHTQYRDRLASERQKLTWYTYDVRRARRGFRAVHTALLELSDSDLPMVGAGLTRTSLHDRLLPLEKKIYFEQGLPDMDGKLPDQLFFIAVDINSISGELSIPQLPIEHLGSLLIAADAFPAQLADVLETFVSDVKMPDRRAALVQLQKGLEAIPPPGRMSRSARKFLDDIEVQKSACLDPGELDACGLEVKYASPSLSDLARWQLDITVAQIAEEKRRRGDNAIAVPGVPASLPAWLVMLLFAAVVAYVDLQLPALVKMLRRLPDPGPAQLAAYEVEYGSAAISAAGYRPALQPHRIWYEAALIIGCAIAFAVFLGWTRPLSIGAPAVAGCLLVIGLECYYLRTLRSTPAAAAAPGAYDP